MDEIVFKIVLAFIGAICMMWIVPTALEIWGINPSLNNSIVNAFIFIVMPFAIAFIGIYKIITVFTQGGSTA